MIKDTYTISGNQYFHLLKAEAQLQYLEGSGVDNWSDYGCNCEWTGEDECIYCTEDEAAFLGFKDDE